MPLKRNFCHRCYFLRAVEKGNKVPINNTLFTMDTDLVDGQRVRSV